MKKYVIDTNPTLGYCTDADSISRETTRETWRRHAVLGFHPSHYPPLVPKVKVRV